MSYYGDLDPGNVLDFSFCTVGTTGAPTVLTGSQVLSVFKGSSTASVTTGVTLTTNFASITGSNHVTIDTSTSAGFYAAGNDFMAILTAGTVGGTSVAGYVVGEFSIQHRSPLRPTTAARTLDVSAGGEAGVDWANVGGQSTAVTLSATSTLALQPTTAGRTLDVTATGGAGIDWGNVENQSTAVTLSATSTLALQPTTAGRTLDVTATGGAGIDWSNVENQATTVALTNTTISGSTITSGTVAAIATGVWQDATAGDFTVTGSIGKSLYINDIVPGGAGGHLISGTNTGPLTVNGGFVGDITGNLSGSVGSVVTKTGYSLSATGLDAVLMADLGAVPSATASIVAGTSYLFMALRNQRVTTTNSDTVSNNAGSVIGTATLSDNGTTFTKGQYG